MKKTLVAFVFAALILPNVSSAAVFNKNLYYGIQKSADVAALQEFLTENGNYSGPITGNFFSLTLAAVKRFQTANNIKPVSGYFGILSRGVANSLLEPEAPIEETGTTTASIAPVLDPVVAPPAAQAPIVDTAPAASSGSATVATMTPEQEKANLRGKGIGRARAYMYVGYEGSEVGKVAVSVTNYFSDETVIVKVDGQTITPDRQECAGKITDSALLLCGWYGAVSAGAASSTPISISYQGIEKSTIIGGSVKNQQIDWF